MTYVDGFVAPIKPGRKDAYIEMATNAAKVFMEYGATQVVECWGDNVPEGKVTDLWRAVAADKAGGEGLVFSWIVWPDKGTHDAGWEKAMADERMKISDDMPFDGKRIIFGGFDVMLDTAA